MFEDDHDKAVGGRQSDHPCPQGGGSSSDFCTTLKLSDIGELHIDEYIELRQLRIQPVWLKVACEVGYEKFVTLWQVFDNHAVETNSHRLYMPKFSSYERNQKTLLVKSLLQQSFDYPDIIKQVKMALGANITNSQINHIRYRL